MILQHLLTASGLSCPDFVKEKWDQGVAVLTGRHALPALREHDVVGCFRAAPLMSPKSLAKARLFLLVRDPRDCQVSWYHARHLHQADNAESVIVDEATIHEDLIREESFDTDVTSLLDWCELSGGHIFRYEDMVMNPLAFIREFAEFSGLPLKRSAIDVALIEASFFQSALDQTNHNRSGVPFEALRTLAPPQLEKLNKRFAPLLARLGYPLDPSVLPEFDLATMVQRDATKRYILGLAEQNGLRVREIAELKRHLANVRAELDQHIRKLAEQNGLRAVEIAEQKQMLARVRSEIEQHVGTLSEQNGLRVIEIAQQKEAWASVHSQVEQYIESLPEENGMRIVEIAELRQALADVRTEIEQLKSQKKKPLGQRFLRRNR